MIHKIIEFKLIFTLVLFNCLCSILTFVSLINAQSASTQCTTLDRNSVCIPGLDQSAYAQRLIQYLECPSQVSLPSRLVGNVLLSDGQLNHMKCVRLLHIPVRQICANDTLAALQLQVKVPNVLIEYGWSFGEHCEGIARVSPQNVYLDFNLEQNALDNQTRLLSSFTTALLDTRFDVQIHRCDTFESRTVIKQQVALICKKVALRDVDRSIQQLFRNRLISFVRLNSFALTQVCVSEPEVINTTSETNTMTTRLN